VAGWAVCRVGWIQGEESVRAYLQKLSREGETGSDAGGLQYCVTCAEFSFLVILVVIFVS